MGAKTATYTPDAKDEGKCLRATAMYTDGKGMDDAMGVSVNAVIADEANRPPRFRAGGVDERRLTTECRYRRHGDECEALHRREHGAGHEYPCRQPRQRGYTSLGR